MALSQTIGQTTFRPSGSEYRYGRKEVAQEIEHSLAQYFVQTEVTTSHELSVNPFVTLQNTVSRTKVKLRSKDSERTVLSHFQKKVQCVTESLEVMGELVSTTRTISEADKNLAIQTYTSAMVQSTLLNHKLIALAQDRSMFTRLFREDEKRTLELLDFGNELDTVGESISVLRKILTVYVCD